jgi:hypothetical protein
MTGRFVVIVQYDVYSAAADVTVVRTPAERVSSGSCRLPAMIMRTFEK